MTNVLIQDALRFLSRLHPSGGLVEVRSIPSVRNSGAFVRRAFYDDAERLLAGLEAVAQVPGGLYVTLNRLASLPPGCGLNRWDAAKRGTSATAEHVDRRTNVCIDCDPVRPAHTSSSDEEHAAALGLAEEIAAALRETGFGEPFLVDSGNGAHVHYAIDLPTQDGGLVDAFLKGVAARFTSAAVEVDTTLSDSPRVIRIAGTMNRKGPDLADRPHRFARIIAEPPSRMIVEIQALKLVADWAKTSGALAIGTSSAAPRRPAVGVATLSAGVARNAVMESWEPADVEALLQKAQLVFDPAKKTDRGGHVWNLAKCPFGAAHTGGGRILLSESGSPAAFCHHSSCSRMGWDVFSRLVSAGSGCATEAVVDLESADSRIPAFPDSAFAGLIGQYRDLVAETTEAPDAFHFASFAAMVGVLIGRRLRMPWGAESLFPYNHVAIIGQTGRAKKSSAMETARSVLLNSALRVNDPESEWKDVVVVSGGGTGEGLADQFADTPATKEAQAISGRRGIILINEFGAILDKIRREQAGSLLDFMIEAADARPRFESRLRSKQAPSFVLTNTAIVVHAASTAEWLAQALQTRDVEIGLVNRFLFIGGESTREIAIRPALASSKIEAFAEPLRVMLAHSQGEFRLSDAALEAQRERYHSYKISPTDELHDRAIARSDVQALRLAMLLAASAGRTVGEPADIDTAWAIVGHSQAVIGGILQRMSTTTRQRLEERVMTAARRISGGQTSPIRKREIQQRLKSSQRPISAEDLGRAIRALASVGLLIEHGDQVWLADVGKSSGEQG